MNRASTFTSPTSGVHAVLYYGAEDRSVDEAARALAAAWLCHNLAEGEACGVCRSCQALARGNHVDLKVIAPIGTSSVIRIHQITARDHKDDEPEQSLQEFFRTAPLFGARKVALISQANRMNGPASNALLKALEEPHSYAKLILATTALGEMLPTILSRCANVPIESGVPGPMSAGQESVHQIAQRAMVAAPIEAIQLSERFREAAGLFEADGARAAQAQALRALAQSLLILQPNRPEWAQSAIEAHRRIVGNGAAILNFDALFAKLTQ